jgi:hypothetical protein
MKCDAHSTCWLKLSVLAAVLTTVGCNNSAQLSSPVVAPKKIAPEESFELIMSTFRRMIEKTPGGFAVPQEGGHSRLITSNRVSSELIPPTKEGEPYRAKVTVDSQSRYSLQQQTSEASDADERSDEGTEQRAAPDPLADPAGLDNLAPSQGSPSGESNKTRPGGATGESVVLRREDEGLHTFDLEYKDGRWVLLTQPNPETELSIKNAFERALATQ